MPRVIKESYHLDATNSDVLAAPSRLAAVPRNGILSLEASANVCTLTNFWQLTLQMPDGEIPFEDLTVPFHGDVAAGSDSVLDSDTQLSVTMEVRQGGHVGVAAVETGTGLLFLMFTLTFP